MRKRSAILLTTATALVFAGTAPAAAKCTKLAFSVNDYGKDGPTKDAKNLLDKYVADWAKERGIKNYSIGKKDVSCELFLDLVVFDEHTCKATALVCWPDGGPSAAPATPAGKKPAPSAKPAPKPKAAAAQ